MTEIFNTLLVSPIINILILIYKMLLFLGVPFTLGFAIIVLTVLIRLLIYPLTQTQIRSMQQMQELKPHLDRIKEKYKHDKKRQQSEMMQLYKQHGINPAAGCLPLLVQLPIFIALYSVFLRVVGEDTTGTVVGINKVLYSPWLHLDKTLDLNFLGVSLAASPLNSWRVAPILLLVPIITALFQFIQSKMMSPTAAKGQPNQKDDFQKVMQTQMIYFLPLMIGFFSFSFPVGLSLYWNTFTIFGIIQQYSLTKKKDAQGANH